MTEALKSGSFWFPLAFGCFAVATVIPAVLVVLSRNIVHSALWLLLSLASMAGLYVLLNAEFLAALQILVYCGGIVVLFLFAIMLTPRLGDPDVASHNRQVLWGALVAVLAGGVFSYVLKDAPWRVAPAADVRYVTGRLADAFMGPYALAFEVTSVILLVAMVGAIVIVRTEPRE
jgi:NADH:ubiquinone oxidoreductase subunit 6 (subunit J)